MYCWNQSHVSAHRLLLGFFVYFLSLWIRSLQKILIKLILFFSLRSCLGKNSHLKIHSVNHLQFMGINIFITLKINIVLTVFYMIALIYYAHQNLTVVANIVGA